MACVFHGQEFYLDLTRATADNFHRSWRKRHGVILDGEVAAVFYRRGALDAAAKLYEKVTITFVLTNVLENYSVLLNYFVLWPLCVIYYCQSKL